MELFSELYNCYYQVVGEILKQAADHPITRQDMEDVSRLYGYEESALVIVPKLIQGDWNFLEPVGDRYHSKVKAAFPAPLSTLQKSWLKAILQDKRVKLFFQEEQLTVLLDYFKDQEPLFHMEDFHYFDQYADGDPYEDPGYQKHFQMALKGIREHRVLKFTYRSGKQNLTEHSCLPCRMEYSSKDDKFRLLSLYAKKPGTWRLETINMARILSLSETDFCVQNPPDLNNYLRRSLSKEPIVLTITNERNALERTMLHFSSYEKRTEKLEGSNQYLCSIYYDQAVETELLIQILSFGPVVRVLGPEHFLAQIKERLRKQKQLNQKRAAP